MMAAINGHTEKERRNTSSRWIVSLLGYFPAAARRRPPLSPCTGLPSLSLLSSPLLFSPLSQAVKVLSARDAPHLPAESRTERLWDRH